LGLSGDAQEIAPPERGWCGLNNEPNQPLLVAVRVRGRGSQPFGFWLFQRIEAISQPSGCTKRKINMTISLAFLAPNLVKAAIDGRLPHGMGVARLADLSADRQRQMLGLPVL